MQLKLLRARKGFIKQMDFAKALGVKQSTLSMWETGKARPDIDMLRKLAEVLQVDIKEVFECF